MSGRRFAERVVTISQESRHRVSPISTLKPSGKADLGRYRRPCWADINYSKWNSYEQAQLLQQLFNIISSLKAMSLHSRCCSDYREELMWQQSWNIQESKKPIAGPQIRLMLQQVWFIPSLPKWPTTWHRVNRVGWKWASDGIIFSPPRMILLNRVLEWLYHQKYPHYTRYEIPLGWYQKLQKTNAFNKVCVIYPA